MIKRLFLSVALCTCLLAVAHAEENCHAKDSVAIIMVFDQGIALNEKFKKSIEHSDKDEYRRLRKSSEQYDDGTVMPCVEQAGRILSARDDPKLAHKLLQLTVSYENSADETISYSLGLIFGVNPQVLENALYRFSSSERKLIAERLQVGWLNAKAKFKKDVVKDRDRRLQKLSS